MGWILDSCTSSCDSYKMINIFKNAIIRRLAYILVTVTLAFLSQCAQAQYTWASPPLSNPSYVQLCTDLATHLTATSSTNVVFTYKSSDSTNNTRCRIGRVQNGNALSDIFYQLSYIPPANCVPPQTQDPNNDSLCITAPPPNPCENLAGGITSYFSANSTYQMCVQGCIVERDSGTCGFNQQGQQGCFLTGVITSTQCTENENQPQPENTPEYDCFKKGLTYGTVNGVVVCVPLGSPNSQPASTVIDGKTTVTNSEGSTTTTTNYNDNGSTVTTTTTTTTIDGQPQTTTTEQDKSSFCSENPNSKICKAEFDPCTENPNLISCQELGEAPPSDEIQNQTISMSSLPVISLPKNESCPAPDTVNIGFATIPISYDPLCQYASAFKPFVIAFAYISAFIIGFNAVRKDS